METPGEDVVVRSVESVLEGGPSKLRSCPNCGSDGVDSYCASCGQRAGNLHTPIGTFIREALDGLLSFDSRVWHTLIVLLYRPGELTLEYWRGRRARYVLVPVFGAVLRLLYRRRERFFVPRLVFALHLFTAAFLLL